MRNLKILLIAITVILLNYSNGQACSSFMLKTNSQQIFGHNLNMGGKIPGMVFINKRDMPKKGYTWAELTSSSEDSISNIFWTSKYGSVTFNCFGRELPDGGMNENGLFIWEMTGGTSFDEVPNRPRLFMSQWMQYQLDNFKTVDEVLDNLSSIGLDGWNWHFFVADKQGKSAGIEFINGVVVIYTGENMPVPLMGNGRYSDDLSFIKEFDGFGGNISIDVNDEQLPGFVKAAKKIKDYDNTGNIVDYGFDILGQLSRTAKWSIIFDVKNMTTYFRTSVYKNIKSFSIKSFDFSPNSPVKILNIQDANLSGDVTANFIDFNHDDNVKLVKDMSVLLYKSGGIEIPADTLINRLSTVYQAPKVAGPEKIEGNWVGFAEYPTTGEPAKVDWQISFENKDGSITGKITDSAGLLANTEIKNLAFENGILKFTVYSHGYVFKISATVSGDGIKGIFDISDESRKGNFHVQLKG